MHGVHVALVRTPRHPNRTPESGAVSFIDHLGGSLNLSLGNFQFMSLAQFSVEVLSLLCPFVDAL